MTDVGAVAAGAADQGGQQIQIYFGGVFDQTVMGAPMYFWGIFVLAMGLVCLGILVMYHRYFILDKIWGFVECYKKNLPLALIRTRYRKAYFKPLKYIAQIFIDEDSPDKWFAPALETSASISGVSLVDCTDYYDWLQDPILNQAIHEIVQEWNAQHPSEDDKIYDPVKFQQLLGDGKLADLFDGQEKVVYKCGDVRIPAFFVVNISKIEQYLPRTRSSAMFGGYTQHMADDMGKEGKVDWKQWVLPIVALMTAEIIVAVICGLIATGKL